MHIIDFIPYMMVVGPKEAEANQSCECVIVWLKIPVSSMTIEEALTQTERRSREPRCPPSSGIIV